MCAEFAVWPPIAENSARSAKMKNEGGREWVESQAHFLYSSHIVEADAQLSYTFMRQRGQRPPQKPQRAKSMDMTNLAKSFADCDDLWPQQVVARSQLPTEESLTWLAARVGLQQLIHGT